MRCKKLNYGPPKSGFKDNSNLKNIFKKDEEDINMKNICKCKGCYGCDQLEESVVLNLGMDVLREYKEMMDEFIDGIVNNDVNNNGEEILFVQAEAPMRKEEIEEEQERLQKITGMKVCILKTSFSYIGIK